ENFIDANTGTGINVNSMDGVKTPMIFSCNTVTNNDGGGVIVSLSSVTTSAGNNSALNFGDSTVNSPGHNSFFSNNGGVYDFRNNSPKDIKAENNWWGTTNTATIDSHIY